MNTLLKPIYGLFLFLSLSLWSAYQAAAQDIFYSKEERFNFQNSDFSVVGNTGNYLYTYTASNKGYFLNAYNDSMALKAIVALDFFPARIIAARFVNYPEKIIVLYQAVERNYIILYAAKLDNRALLTGKPKAIDSVKSSLFGGDESFFKTAVSSDKGKIMVYGLDKQSIHTALLNDNLDILHQRTYSLSTGRKETINQALLDDEGKFYFSVTEESGSKNYSNNFKLFQLAPEGKSLTSKTLSGGSLYYSGLHSKIDKQTGLLYTAGFYSDHRNGNLEGVVYCAYNPSSTSFSSQKLIPFTASIKNDAAARNKKKAFNDAKVRELIIKNGGGFLLVAENVFISTQTEMTPGWGYYSWYYSPAYPDRVIKEYNYGDILLLNFNDSSRLDWYKFIRKNQYSQDDNGLFSSFAFLNAGSSLVFLFNNFNSQSNEMELVAIDNKGNVQMQPLKTGNIGNADWLPRRAVQVAKTTWVIPILNRNNLFFAKVVF